MSLFGNHTRTRTRNIHTYVRMNVQSILMPRAEEEKKLPDGRHRQCGTQHTGFKYHAGYGHGRAGQCTKNLVSLLAPTLYCTAHKSMFHCISSTAHDEQQNNKTTAKPPFDTVLFLYNTFFTTTLSSSFGWVCQRSVNVKSKSTKTCRDQKNRLPPILCTRQ